MIQPRIENCRRMDRLMARTHGIVSHRFKLESAHHFILLFVVSIISNNKP